MKKIFLTFSIGFISLAAFSNSSSIRHPEVPENPALLGMNLPKAKNVNFRALRDFQSRFNEVPNASWFSDDNGFVSYFVRDGFGNRVFYDKRGHWQVSLIFYGEDKLPRDIRASVRSTYFDLAITLVEEVQTPYGMAYIVTLEDKTNIRVLNVNTKGEIEIIQDLVKEQ